MVVQGSMLNKTEVFSGRATDTTVFYISIGTSGILELHLEEFLNAEIR